MAGSQEEVIPIGWVPEIVKYDSAVSQAHITFIYQSINSNIKVEEKERIEGCEQFTHFDIDSNYTTTRV